MRLVVNQTLEKEGGAPARRPEGPRPALTLLQGGLARPKRLGPTRPAAPAAAPTPRAEPVLRIEEIPIYLRPIPAWVPRLW